MGTIRRRSRIETELPKELREELNRLLLEGATYEDASAWCKARGYDISKSSVGRYGKVFFEAYANVRRFEDQSRALQGEVGDGLLLEEATTKLLLQRVMAALIDGGADVMEIPRLLSDVAKLQSSSVQRERMKAQVAEQVRKETLAEVAGRIDDAEKAAKRHRRPLDAATIDLIREQIGL